MLALFAALKSKFMGYLAVAAGVVAVLWAVYLTGRKSASSKQAREALKNVGKKKDTDDEVARLSPDARRDRLRKWMPDAE